MRLIINTLGGFLDLALCDTTGLVQHRICQQLDKGHAEAILPCLDDLLHQSAASLACLSEIWVVKGPGNFTAIRIGLSVASGLGLALDIRVFGVSIFHLGLAALSAEKPGGLSPLSRPAGQISLWVPAQGASGYRQDFEVLKDGFRSLGVPYEADLDPDQQQMPQAPQYCLVLAGQENGEDGASITVDPCDAPGVASLLDDQECAALSDTAPLYVRPAKADPAKALFRVAGA